MRRIVRALGRARHSSARRHVFAAQLGKTLAPKEVLFVGDIPKREMPKSCGASFEPRISAKNSDTSALENPVSLDEESVLKYDL